MSSFYSYVDLTIGIDRGSNVDRSHGDDFINVFVSTKESLKKMQNPHPQSMVVQLQDEYFAIDGSC